MFERFDDSARKTFAHCHGEALRLCHNYIDDGHILLALLQDGAAASMLSKLLVFVLLAFHWRPRRAGADPPGME